MKNLIIVFFTIFCCSFSYCQEYQITGNISDMDELPLIGATVVVLDPVDSTMVAFGVTDEKGKFLIYEVPAGSQILQISYTGFNDHSEIILLEGDENKIKIDDVILEVSSAILEEVSIKAEHIPMGILGDTINYNAAAFKTKPGASVEDLLKKLPGIEVARDGSIKAQGKDVENVLVDGKEFFSGDATIATKNLDAEAVDKVQVFDKKSEEEEFTGIDDGNEDKTINLQLKEDYKNGGFGKVEVNGGSEETRLGKLNYNRFTPSVQASIIANTNNINQQAFSFNEYVDFMGGFQNVIATGGFTEFGFLSSRRGVNPGIKNQSSVGTNLNIDHSKKLKFNANYLFARSNNDINQFGKTENFTNDDFFTTLDTSMSNELTTNHRLNSKLKFNPNPKNNFTWNLRGFALLNNNSSVSNTNFLISGTPSNRTSNILANESTSYSIGTDVLYKRKFDKKGRNLLSRAKYERVSREEMADLQSTFSALNDFQFLDQIQNFDNFRTTISGSTTFTEPIGKKLYLNLSYSLFNEDQSPDRSYFDREGTNLVLNEEISRSFMKNWSYHNLGASIKRNRKKLKLDAGLSLRRTSLTALDEEVQVNTDGQRIYLLPSFSINKTVKRNSSIEMSYNTQVNAPSLAQMVNQVNNRNPNFLIFGNPDLQPEYSHSISLRYNTFDSFNFSSSFWSVRASFTPNKIVNSRTFLDGLITQVLPVNAEGHQSYSLYGNYSTPIRMLKVKMSLNTSASYSTYSTFVDNILNDIQSGTANVGLRLENRKKEVVDAAVGVRVDASAFSNNFNSNFDKPFINHSLYSDVFIDLGKGWNVSSEYDFKTFNSAFFDESQVFHLWNASLSKAFLDNKLMLKLTAFDMLNQNTGVDRSGGLNTLSDSRFNTLGRYVMIGASYRIGISKKSGIQVDFD